MKKQQLYQDGVEAQYQLNRLKNKVTYAQQRLVVLRDDLAYFRCLLTKTQNEIDALKGPDWLGIINCGWSHRKVLRVITLLEALCSKK